MPETLFARQALLSTSLESAETVLEPATVLALRGVGRARRWAAQQVIISRGRPTTAAFLLLRGKLRVSVATGEGEEQLLRWLVPGEITGLSSVLAGSPYPAELSAAEASEVLHIERQHVIELILQQPAVGLDLLRMLGLRVNQLMDVLAERGLQGLEHRVTAVLERLARFNAVPVADGLMLRVSQEDIARAAAASRQRVNIQLRQMQSRGLVRLGYRHIVLLGRA
jgi:CRP/FNR family cyclic AMP-dependent transcriptional regulator